MLSHCRRLNETFPTYAFAQNPENRKCGARTARSRGEETPSANGFVVVCVLLSSFLATELAAAPYGQGITATKTRYAVTLPSASSPTDIWSEPVDVEELAAFVESAYDRHGAAAFATSVKLRAELASSVLSVADHHHRLSKRMGPGFEGFYLALRHPHPQLEFVDRPYFHDQPYSVDSPLKQMVILRVTGEIGYRPLDYEAFLFQFVSPEGSCRIELADPVFPSVNDFAQDSLLADAFPDCEGPQATAQRVLLGAVPDVTVTGFDDATGSILSTVSSKGSAADFTSNWNVKTDGPKDGCRDNRKKKDYGWSSSGVCRDLFFGGGNWIRGGSYEQIVSCIPEGDGCGVQTASSEDDLHSSIRPIDSWNCDCCWHYGATVTGNPDAMELTSKNGTSGGHVAIARSPKAWRTSSSSTMNALELSGDCGGTLDLPFHGSKVGVSANRSADFKAQTTLHANKSEIGGWDANRVISHLCKPSPGVKKPEEASHKLLPKPTKELHAPSPSTNAYTKNLMTY